MVDLQQYEEYWSGITERIPQIKKVVPVTFDPDMGALVQGLKADELPALLLIIKPLRSVPDGQDRSAA